MGNYCTSCGRPIPDGQWKSCSMCYGDIDYGSDGYYRAWAESQDYNEPEQEPEQEPEPDPAEPGKE